MMSINAKLYYPNQPVFTWPQLAHLVLTCISRPEKEVTDQALDYFVNLNTVRTEGLKAVQFGVLLPALVWLGQNGRASCTP